MTDSSNPIDRGERPAPAPATEDWVNEGGSLAPSGADVAAPARPAAGPRRTKRTFSDTPEWCRERAAADLVSAGAMGTENGRLRLEHSAASWAARADLLQRLHDGSALRQATARAAGAKGATAGLAAP